MGGGALGTIFFNYGGTAPWRWHLQDNGEQMRLTSTGLGIGTSSPVSRLNVSGTTGFSWVGNGTSTALATIGTQGTGGSLFVNTASINSSFASGLAVDGTYSGPSSVVNLKAVGVNSGGGYNSSLAFHTSFETTLAEAMRLDSSGNLGIGTSSPGTKLQVLGTIAAQIGADGSNATGIRIYGSGSEKRVDFTGADGLANERISGIGTGGPGILTFSVNNNSAVMTERMRLDSSGNLGLGVTPSAWNSDYKAIQVGANGSIAGRVGASNSVDVTSNGFRNAAGNWQYIATNPVARFMVDGSIGGFQWFTAPSGTAGNAISFSQVMTLSASGDLGLGTTSPTNSTGYSTFSVNGSTGGQIVFQTGGVYKQSIFSAASDLNLYNSVAGNIIFATNATERARIDSSGNLLVGTTSAVGKVTIQDGALAFSGNASAPASNVGIYRGGSADNLIFATGGSERARIDSSGRLGVGTTTTSNARVTSVGVADNYPAFRAETSATTSQQQISFVNPNGVVGTIATDGSATSYNTSSDYRLKNITGPITTSGAYIDSLNPVEGTWKADGSTFVGLIAHEVQEASRTTVATGVKDGEEMQGMDYSSAEIIANMLAELKSLRARVAALESI